MLLGQLAEISKLSFCIHSLAAWDFSLAFLLADSATARLALVSKIISGFCLRAFSMADC